MMDLTPLVHSQNVGPLVLRRAGPPTQTAHGDYTPAAETVLSLDPVAVHTLAGRDLEHVPEADRHREQIQLYTTVRLHCADGGQVADRVEYRGRTWRVTHADDYALQGAVWMAIATLEDVS